ncbi:MAG: MBL fold metallo-hydrolase [Hyphomicrobiaceae bacterium]
MTTKHQTLISRRNLLAGAAGTAAAGAILTATQLPTNAKSPKVGVQVSQAYRRKLGAYEVTVLSDGFVDLPHAIWSNISAEHADSHLTDSFVPTGKIRNGVNAYLINTGDKLILIDSGARDLFGPNLGQFPNNLSGVGVKPSDIDQILITHAHPDHVGGLFTARGKVTIPKGQVFIDETDLDFWTSESHQSKAIDMAKPWFDTARAWKTAYDGRISTFKGETDLGNGISAFPLPGHTPGQSGFRIESQGQVLLILGDAVISAAIQFANPDAAAIWETDAEDSKKSRRRIFDIAARDRTLVSATHLPFPSFGYVDRREDNTYAWVPEEWQYAT